MDINIFMNKKRVLIIGTSHSESTCVTYDEPNNVQYLQNSDRNLRWHDYFKTEYDCEVVNLSKAAVTAQGQLFATYNYFLDNLKINLIWL